MSQTHATAQQLAWLYVQRTGAALVLKKLNIFGLVLRKVKVLCLTLVAVSVCMYVSKGWLSFKQDLIIE